MSIAPCRLVPSVTLMLLVAAGSVGAQVPDEFTNLRILPKDIGKPELVSTMRGFSLALGERCSFCHVDDEATGESDWASDVKEQKRVARAMMKMVDDINGVYLAKIDVKSDTRVGCVTCHHGVASPRTIESVVLETAEKDGLDAALAEYRDLRERYYGSASYDFGAAPLNEIARTLAKERSDVPGAITVAKLALELHPEDAHTYLLLGQFHQAAGDRSAAIASVERCLELEPDNRWAKSLLEKLRASE